jgi:hypothetical protein
VAVEAESVYQDLSVGSGPRHDSAVSQVGTAPRAVLARRVGTTILGRPRPSRDARPYLRSTPMS